MTYAGARGETATQMAAALHYTLDADTLAGDFGSLIADLNSAGQGNYSLSVADALWGQQGFSFLAPFLNLMQADYGGGLHQVDFEKPPKPPGRPSTTGSHKRPTTRSRT